MGTIRRVRDPHNLSHSRLTGFFGCPARAGYESFYENSKRTASPYWLPGGSAVHYLADTIIRSTVAVGKFLAPDQVDKLVKRAKSHLYRVLSGEWPPRGHLDNPSRLLKVFWMSGEEEERLGPDMFKKTIQERKYRYINNAISGIRAVALRCTVPSPFRWMTPGMRFDRLVNIRSPRNPEIKIPVWGELDLLEQRQDFGFIITDFKTGSFNNYLQEDLEGNEQMLIYWLAVREKYGVDPVVAYFVSLNVFANDVREFGAGVLEQPQYRVQARIRFEEHFPELRNEYDDVWAVLNFLWHPPLSAADRYERDAWEPQSALGIKHGLKRHVEQNRLIPSIGRHCGMCPERPQCRADNPEDWQEYESRQKLGNVVDQLVTIPEEWADPLPDVDEPTLEANLREMELQLYEQFGLFTDQRPVRVSPLKRHTFKGKEWKEMGFFTPAELRALGNRMHEIIPVENGEPCPCKRTERINPILLSAAAAFYHEREQHLRSQEAEGKTRSGKGGTEKAKDLYESVVVREALKDCPIPGCPFAKKDPPPPVENVAQKTPYLN